MPRIDLDALIPNVYCQGRYFIFKIQMPRIDLDALIHLTTADESYFRSSSQGEVKDALLKWLNSWLKTSFMDDEAIERVGFILGSFNCKSVENLNTVVNGWKNEGGFFNKRKGISKYFLDGYNLSRRIVKESVP